MQSTNTNLRILKSTLSYISIHTEAEDDRGTALETKGLYLSL